MFFNSSVGHINDSVLRFSTRGEGPGKLCIVELLYRPTPERDSLVQEALRLLTRSDRGSGPVYGEAGDPG